MPPGGGGLPHEWCFGGFLAITGLRLAWVGGAAWPWAGLFLGSLGYTFFPAGGPHRFLNFATPLQGVWLYEVTLKSVNDGSNAVDAFPSIHFAATLYLLLFDWKHYRARFWCLLGPCLLLWFSTMFLRFHYFIDLVAGLVVAVIGRWVAQRSACQESLSDK